MSTWERASKFSQFKTLIKDFKKNDKAKKYKAVREGTDKFMNPYRTTEIHGHFLYGDKPKEILSRTVKYDSNGRKSVYLEVAWQPR
jgi:hypothetical protein